MLSPQWRTVSGNYRVYTDDDLERASRILIFREIGMPLKEIKRALEQPELVRSQLEKHLVQLQEDMSHLQWRVHAVQRLLKEEPVTYFNKAAELFGPEWDGWQQEAQERWGDTPEWEQSQTAMENADEATLRKAQAEQAEFVDALGLARERKVEPGSEEAAQLVDSHRATIERWYTCTLEKQVLLSSLYQQDPRFHSMYGSEENAHYLRALILGEAERQGIDPSSLTWG